MKKRPRATRGLFAFAPLLRRFCTALAPLLRRFCAVPARPAGIPPGLPGWPVGGPACPLRRAALVYIGLVPPSGSRSGRRRRGP